MGRLFLPTEKELATMFDFPRVILAADGLPLERVLLLGRTLGDRLHGIKIHAAHDRDCACYTGLCELDIRVWIDYKLHDIPKSVADRAFELSATAHGVSILSAHASGGERMLRAAKQMLIGEIYAVTILTSLTDEEIFEIYHCPRNEAVAGLARIAARAGVHGIVCSPLEVKMLRAMPELARIKLVTPGIRMPGQSLDDQRRVGTPEEAVRDGADHLVIGRPITQAEDPVAALDAIEESIQAGLVARK